MTRFPWTQCSNRVPSDGSTTRPPPSLLTGSLGMVSPLSLATMERLRLPLSFSCSFALNSELNTPARFLFLNDREPKARPPSWNLLIRVVPFPALPRGDRRLSQLPSRPRCCSALLFDPGRTSTPNHCGVSVLSPLSQTRRLPLASFFRDSITELCNSLPTLEDVISDSPTKVRFRWWVKPFRTGCSPPGLDRGFLMLVLSFILSVLCFCFEHHPRLSGLWLAPCD